jgi:hypothetical protein
MDDALKHIDIGSQRSDGIDGVIHGGDKNYLLKNRKIDCTLFDYTQRRNLTESSKIKNILEERT